MLAPKKVKHRKLQKGRRRQKGISYRGHYLSFGNIGLKALEGKWIDARQIEAARKAMTRHVKRGGKIWIRIFPDQGVTSKGEQGVQGGGKGSPEKFVVKLKPGVILFEMDGIDIKLATRALALAAHKLPIKTKIITKE